MAERQPHGRTSHLVVPHAARADPGEGSVRERFQGDLRGVVSGGGGSREKARVRTDAISDRLVAGCKGFGAAASPSLDLRPATHFHAITSSPIMYRSMWVRAIRCVAVPSSDDPVDTPGARQPRRLFQPGGGPAGLGACARLDDDARQQLAG